MTSIGHFSILSETIHNPSICTLIMTLQSSKDNPWTVDRFCQLWKNSDMPSRHPRFHLVASKEEDGYFVPAPSKQPKSRTDHRDSTSTVNVEMHVSESLPPRIPRLDIIQRIQRLQTDRWDLSEKLWHVDLVPWIEAGSAGTGNSTTPTKNEDNTNPTVTSSGSSSSSSEMGESLLFFRGHHVLADGASIGAALMDLADEAAQLRGMIVAELKKRGLLDAPWWKQMLQQLLFLFWFLTGSVQAIWYHVQLLLVSWWYSNPWTLLEQMHTQKEQADRTVSFSEVGSVEQAKWVARTLAGRRATLNDVFCAAVSKALAKQLEWHRQRFSVPTNEQQVASTTSSGILVPKSPISVLPRMKHIQLGVPVHLKGGLIMPGESVGNSLGAFSVCVPCEDGNDGKDHSSQQRLQQVHKELDWVKKRPGAFLSHYLAKLSTWFPQSWIRYAFTRSHGSTCVVTNVRVLDRLIHFDGSPVLSMYGFVPLPPGVPIGVVVGSYNGQVHLTVTAQPWAVPNADQFLSWILEEYVHLVQEATLVQIDKDAAAAADKNHTIAAAATTTRNDMQI